MSASDSTILIRQIAVEAKLVTEGQIERALDHRLKTNSRLPLEEVLLQLGLIDGAQFKTLMTLQRSARKDDDEIEESRLFGKLVLNRGLATPEQLERCLMVQARLAESGQFKNLGEIMVAQGLVNAAQVKSLLGDQNQVIMECTTCTQRYNVLRQWVKTSKCPECGALLTPAGEGLSVVATIKKEQPAIGNLIGTTIGGCKVLEMLGKGSMGAVYKARHLGLNRLIALKVMPAPSRDPQTVQRLLSEARAIAKLEHPNIVQVYDVGFHQHLFFIVMQLLVGQTLKARMEEMGALPEDELLSVIRDIARGLQAAHEKAIIHRDLKMDNVIISEDGKARITDFGLAADRQTRDQLAGFVVGTPHYISPEQWVGQTVDARSDLYSLGVIFYTIASGTRPFEGNDVPSLMNQHLKITPKNPKEHNSMLDDRLCAIIRKCLIKQPSKRYQSADEILKELERYQHGEAPEAMGLFQKMVKCGFCEELNAAGELKCRICKEPLGRTTQKLMIQPRKDEVKCPGCRTMNVKGARACQGCGKAICRHCQKRLALPNGYCEPCLPHVRAE